LINKISQAYKNITHDQDDNKLITNSISNSSSLGIKKIIIGKMSSFSLNFFLNNAPKFQDLNQANNITNNISNNIQDNIQNNLKINDFTRPISKRKKFYNKEKRFDKKGKLPNDQTMKLNENNSNNISNNISNNNNNMSNNQLTNEESINSSLGNTNKDTNNSQKKLKCKCIYSQCLKQYCDCFAAGEFCDGCFCSGCENTQDHPLIHQKKNLKVKPIPTQSNFLGCNCTNSHCQKKYCECFKGGAFCSPKCHCHDCKNKDPNKVNKSKQQDQVEVTEVSFQNSKLQQDNENNENNVSNLSSSKVENTQQNQIKNNDLKQQNITTNNKVEKAIEEIDNNINSNLNKKRKRIGKVILGKQKVKKLKQHLNDKNNLIQQTNETLNFYGVGKQTKEMENVVNYEKNERHFDGNVDNIITNIDKNNNNIELENALIENKNDPFE